MILRARLRLVCFSVLAISFLASDSHLHAAPVPADKSDTLTTRIGDLEVSPQAIPWGDQPVPSALLQAQHGDNLAEALAGLPGVTAVRRSADAAEPVIRGLGWERVQTLLGAVPLYGACPGRMDPPATYLGPTSFDRVDVSRGGGMGLMPGATGGAIHVDPQYARPAGSPDGWTPFLEGGYGSAREAYHIDAGVFGGRGGTDVRAAAGMRETSDYTSPDGIRVPADASSYHADLSIGNRVSDHSRLWAAVSFVHEEDVDFPALPMDNIDTDFQARNAGYTWRSPDSGWSEFSLTSGMASVDHLMDNSMKPTAKMMPAETTAETRSWGVHAKAVHRGARRVTIGLDATGLTRDAVRTRTLTAMDMTYFDHLWPKGRQNNLGVATEVVFNPQSATRWTLTGRFDAVDSRVRAADDPSLQGLTIRQQWDRYFALGTEDPDRTESVGAGSVRVDRALTGRMDGFVRAGFSTRAAGITERYYAFAPAPGGYQLGNPTLPAEKKRELEAGVTWQKTKISVHAGVFGSWFSDYILPQIIDRIDVNGDDLPDAIKGFLPVDARLYGGELGLEWRPRGWARVPVSVAVVRGENTTGGRDLPEIPPVSGSAELRLRAHAATGSWFAARCDFAADQNRIDPLFGENATPGYAVWSVALATRPVAGLKVDLRVGNLFDREYHDHLTRESALNDGDLLKGQEIPALGRNVRLSARMEF